MAKPNPTTEQEPATAQEQVQPTSRSRGAAVNRVILVGRLTADPVLRYTSSGIAVASIRLVTNDREEPEYHDLVLWRQLAELAAKYLAKGRLVYIEGRLHGRTWATEDGTTRRSVEIVAENLQFLSSRPSEPSEG